MIVRINTNKIAENIATFISVVSTIKAMNTEPRKVIKPNIGGGNKEKK